MIKIVRLVTGEDLISDMSETRPGFVLLKKPHRLIFSQEGLASMPLCPFSKTTEYEISSSNILFECDPEEEIRDSYANQVGAIVIASSGIVTP